MNGNYPDFEALENSDLEHKLAGALNRFSAENASNTPDFILAQFLLGCLAAWNTGVQQREKWYERDARPTATTGLGVAEASALARPRKQKEPEDKNKGD